MCDGCEMSFGDFMEVTASNEKLTDFLRNHGVLAERVVCKSCGRECNLNDEGIWRCQKISYTKEGNKKIRKKCNFKQSAKKGTVFDNSHLTIKTICQLVASVITRPPPRIKYLVDEFQISKRTAVDWCSFIREVFLHWAFNHNTEMLGGQGKIVEIDEAKFGNRKYGRGRIIKGQWLFGGFERDSKKLFVVPVENRTKEVLLDIIKQQIAPGTTIVSDCWKAYDCLKDENYLHLTVNHSLNFIDPDTGAHTQNIERLWREVRSKTPRYGRKELHFTSYIAEFYFVRHFTNHRSRIHEIFKNIGQLYNPYSFDLVESVCNDKITESNLSEFSTDFEDD